MRFSYLERGLGVCCILAVAGNLACIHTQPTRAVTNSAPTTTITPSYDVPLPPPGSTKLSVQTKEWTDENGYWKTLEDTNSITTLHLLNGPQKPESGEYIFAIRPTSAFRGHIEDFQQGNLKFRLVIAASGDRSMMEAAIGYPYEAKTQNRAGGPLPNFQPGITNTLAIKWEGMQFSTIDFNNQRIFPPSPSPKTNT